MYRGTAPASGGRATYGEYLNSFSTLVPPDGTARVDTEYWSNDRSNTRHGTSEIFGGNIVFFPIATHWSFNRGTPPSDDAYWIYGSLYETTRLIESGCWSGYGDGVYQSDFYANFTHTRHLLRIGWETDVQGRPWPTRLWDFAEAILGATIDKILLHGQFFWEVKIDGRSASVPVYPGFNASVDYSISLEYLVGLANDEVAVRRSLNGFSGIPVSPAVTRSGTVMVDRRVTPPIRTSDVGNVSITVDLSDAFKQSVNSDPIHLALTIDPIVAPEYKASFGSPFDPPKVTGNFFLQSSVAINRMVALMLDGTERDLFGIVLCDV